MWTSVWDFVCWWQLSKQQQQQQKQQQQQQKQQQCRQFKCTQRDAAIKTAEKAAGNRSIQLVFAFPPPPPLLVFFVHPFSPPFPPPPLRWHLDKLQSFSSTKKYCCYQKENEKIITSGKLKKKCYSAKCSCSWQHQRPNQCLSSHSSIALLPIECGWQIESKYSPRNILLLLLL